MLQFRGVVRSVHDGAGMFTMLLLWDYQIVFKTSATRLSWLVWVSATAVPSAGCRRDFGRIRGVISACAVFSNWALGRDTRRFGVDGLGEAFGVSRYLMILLQFS